MHNNQELTHHPLLSTTRGGAPVLVDVNLVTYNHEKFIAHAIESVLDQQTDFDYRLIIGDDCSTDNTVDIIKDYAKRVPDKINLVLNPVHRGIKNKDRVGTDLIRRSTAKYIALLDGDDYWTDTRKLQKQVDFLEANSDFVICCHNVRMFYEDRSKSPSDYFPRGVKNIITIEDLLLNNCIHTGAAVFRRGLFSEFPDWYHTSRLGDWLLHILNARYGKIRYFDEVMAAYRVHSDGIWSSTSPVDQGLEMIEALDHVDRYLGFEYKKLIRVAKACYYDQLYRVSYGKGDWSAGRRYFCKSFWYSDLQLHRNLLSHRLRFRAPIVYKFLRRLKDVGALLARLINRTA